jgi:glutamate-1-semialdehyde aminotransferase
MRRLRPPALSAIILARLRKPGEPHQAMLYDLFLGMLNHGVIMAPRAMGAISTAMTEQDLKEFVKAVDDVVAEQELHWRELGG